MNDATQKKLFSKWPGPHTWLINVNNRCPNWLKSNSKIALRIPSFSKCQDLARSIDMAITSSSLNLSGKIPLKNYRDVCRFLPNQVKLIRGAIGKNKSLQLFKTLKLKILLDHNDYEINKNAS